MKRQSVRMFAHALFALALGCGGTQSSETPDAPRPFRVDEARSEVAALLDRMHAAAAASDEEAYFAAFSADGVFLGTDATERWDMRAFRTYAHPHFSAGRGWRFAATRREIAFEGADVAFFDEDLETEGLGPARGSGVVVRRAGGWRVRHYNLSLTIPNERFESVRAALSAPDEENAQPESVEAR